MCRGAYNYCRARQEAFQVETVASRLEAFHQRFAIGKSWILSLLLFQEAVPASFPTILPHMDVVCQSS